MSTYTPIASVTLSSAQSSVTFSGIPQTYTDLVLVVTTPSGQVAQNLKLELNSDTSTNYSLTTFGGNGTSAFSDRETSTATPSFFYLGADSNGIAHFQNYSNTTTYKTVLCRTNVASANTIGRVLLWRNTSAITSIRIKRESTNDIASGATFNLYGVANASITNVAKATGGDSVYTDGTYWYHIFRSSGTFTPTQALTADYLVVAGGGGGGSYYGGGGGAGGMRCTVTATGGGGSLESALSLTAQAYTVTVGAGGTGGTSLSNFATSGSNSVFSTITSTGGGKGSTDYDGGATGGSGGGGGEGQNGAAGTANQGYAGGNGTSGGTNDFYECAGGGGGASAVGSNGARSSSTAGNGGNGGNGVATSITGSSVTYAGGGGGGRGSALTGSGGTGGTGGGGNGSTGASNGVAGTANTGGGGGGVGAGGVADDGGNGGSGIVIVRYAA